MSVAVADPRDFVVTYDPKPIPDRRFDWTAVQPNWDVGMAIGYGKTRHEAIFDLLDQLLEVTK